MVSRAPSHHCRLLAVLALVFALVGSIPASLACSTPPGACTLDNCKSLWGLTPPYQSKGGPTADKRIGWIYGVYNKNINGGNATGFSSVNVQGGIVNWEVFGGIDYTYVLMNPSEPDQPVDTRGITDLASCCVMCAQTDNCWVYQFFDNMDYTKIKLEWDSSGAQYARYAPYNFWGDRQCYLYSGGSDNLETGRGAPSSGTQSQQSGTSGWPNKWVAPSWVGGMCNGNTSVKDDPHFTGAHGTRFEFNGDIDGTFALITDERLHVNVKLGGYLDDHTYGATKTKDGKAVRTWIREVGLLWKDDAGVRHNAVLTARKGRKMERGNGFISSFVLDGKKMEVPRVVEEGVSEGLFSLSMLRQVRRGPYDVDSFELTVKGLFTATLKLRVAHPLLQTATEAYAHFNVHINDLQATSKVHGILGQTFRSTVAQTVKSLEYRMLNRLMGTPIVADGDSGRGFLDGEPMSYKTSGILATDCAFSSFTS